MCRKSQGSYKKSLRNSKWVQQNFRIKDKYFKKSIVFSFRINKHINIELIFQHHLQFTQITQKLNTWCKPNKTGVLCWNPHNSDEKSQKRPKELEQDTVFIH